jgi:predicted HTH transcriptional regulator
VVESNRVEFKIKLTDDLEKEVVAFLNSHEGGLLYIGIDPSGKVHPLADIDALQLKIKDRLKYNISPSILGLFDVVIEERDAQKVINAIIHNDYTHEIPPKFEIFDDRLEITSAGVLPAGMSLEEFFEGVSNPRNKELMRIYKDLEMVEQLGSGIPRILRAYPRESFVFMEHFTRMIFAKNDGGSIGGSIEKEEVNQRWSNGGQIGGQIQLTDRQKDILGLIKMDSTITRKHISELLDINQSAIIKHLAILKEKGAIRRIGGTRGYWEVIE